MATRHFFHLLYVLCKQLCTLTAIYKKSDNERTNCKILSKDNKVIRRSCHKTQIFGPWILYLIYYSFIYNYVLGDILTIKKYMNCKKITLMKIYIIKFTIFYSFASYNWKDRISKSRVQTEKLTAP